MSRAHFIAAFSSLVALAASGCITVSVQPPASSRAPAHEGSTPLLAPNPLLWSEQSVPRKLDLLTDRLQTWVDRLDSRVREDLPLGAFVMPRPYVVVDVSDGHARARVDGVLVCYRQPTTVAASESKLGTTADVAVLGRAGWRPVKADACREGKSEPREFAAWFNSLGGACSVRVEGEGFAIAGCAGPFFETGGVGYYASGNRITVSPAWIAKHKNETALVGELAHMMAHIYRAHVVTNSLTTRHGYFYRQEEPPRAGRPLRLGNSAELEREMARFDANTDRGEDLENEFQEFRARLADERVKRYTAEDEAWEFAGEYVSKIGLDPRLIDFDIEYELAAHGWTIAEVAPVKFKESWDSYRARAANRTPVRARESEDMDVGVVIFN